MSSPESDSILPIVWPSIKDVYKFVLVEIRNENYLKFRETYNEFHGEILGRLLDEFNIEYETFRHSKIDCPTAKKEGEYHAIAMGSIGVYPDKKSASIISSSISGAYPSYPANDNAIEILRNMAPEWNFKII